MAVDSNVTTIRSQTLQLLADVTENPKPSYRIDGQEMLWGEYVAQLRSTVEWCDLLIQGGDPCEVRSRGV